MIRGLDAWSGQGVLPFEALEKLGLRFLIAKCKQGNDGVDPAFLRNIAQAKARGWITGAYHFPYPLPHLDPVAQAEMFFKASEVGSFIGELPPGFDFEWPAPQDWAKHGCNAVQLSEWARKCCTRMKELWGCPVMIYDYPWFHAEIVKGGADISWMSEHYWWPADYKASGRVPGPAETPFVPEPWKSKGQTWTIWQHDGDKGLLLPNGVDADFCVFNGDEAELLELAGIKPASDEGGPIARFNDDIFDALRDLARKRD